MSLQAPLEDSSVWTHLYTYMLVFIGRIPDPIPLRVISEGNISVHHYATAVKIWLRCQQKLTAKSLRTTMSDATDLHEYDCPTSSFAAAPWTSLELLLTLNSTSVSGTPNSGYLTKTMNRMMKHSWSTMANNEKRNVCNMLLLLICCVYVIDCCRRRGYNRCDDQLCCPLTPAFGRPLPSFYVGDDAAWFGNLRFMSVYATAKYTVFQKKFTLLLFAIT